VYLPRYLTQQDPAWEASDAQLRDEFIAGLVRMYPDFRPAQVLALEISRVREVLAVTTLDYTASKLPARTTSVPNVFIANSAQIAQGTLNVNETIALAHDAADALLVELDMPTNSRLGV
jgi:protoporphyrinogen oxidase